MTPQLTWKWGAEGPDYQALYAGAVFVGSMRKVRRYWEGEIYLPRVELSKLYAPKEEQRETMERLVLDWFTQAGRTFE